MDGPMHDAGSLKVDEARSGRPTRASRRAWTIGGALVGAVATYLISRTFVEESAARTLAIFVVAAVFWATEALPLFATALLVVAMEVVFLATAGGLAEQFSAVSRWMGLQVGPVREIKAGTFFAPFASDIVMLFMGGFLLSAAVVKHGVDSAGAARMLGPFSRSPAMLVGGVLGVSAFFSMWMSNTACTAMMIAIVLPIASRAAPGSRVPTALVLAATFGANIGGMGTPIGTPPNAIAFEALNRAGVGISFIEWMLIAIPLVVAMLAVAWMVLVRLFPGAPGETLEVPRDHAPIGRRGWITIVIAVITVGLWLTGGLHGLASGAVALLAAAALTALGILGREDVDSIDWNVLILIWGGLAISDAVTASGLGEALGRVPLDHIGGGWALGAIFAVIAVVVSTFMSNTAAAGLLVPMAMAFGVEGREEAALVAALGTSFAMALPVSTPPNALAYATGRVPLGAMIRAGTLVGAIGVVALAAGFRFILPVVLGAPGTPAP